MISTAPTLLVKNGFSTQKTLASLQVFLFSKGEGESLDWRRDIRAMVRTSFRHDVGYLSLSHSPFSHSPRLSHSIVVLLLLSSRICFSLSCVCGIFLSFSVVVLCFYFIFLYLSFPLSLLAFGEGEIISNYRESRRCRPSPCASRRSSAESCEGEGARVRVCA